MKIWIYYVFALVAISFGETLKTFTEGGWQSDGDTVIPTLLSPVQTHYLPNQSSLATTYTSFQQAPKSMSSLTQHFGYEKKPIELDAIPHEYVRTVVKPYPIYINEKQSNTAYAEAGSDVWPSEMIAYQNSIESGPTAHHHMSALNHVTHLSPVVPMPQVSSVNSYTPISTVKHLESQISTAVPPGNSYNTQTHTSYAPMASYSLPSVAPFEQVQTVVKPYHTSMPAVKHIEPQMNSIVPMHSVSHVTAYNQLPSATHYAQMQSVTPFEHIQTIVKPYPVYIKEEQHQPAYIVEQSAPSPSPPPPSVASNFWHPDTFVYNKPTFTYHNSADSYYPSSYPFFHSEPVHAVHPVQNVFKPYPIFIKEKQPPRTFSASGSNFWSTTTGEGNTLNNSKAFIRHKNFLIKRKSMFNQR